MTTRQFFCEIRILQASSGLEPVKPKLSSCVLLRIFRRSALAICCTAFRATNSQEIEQVPPLLQLMVSATEAEIDGVSRTRSSLHRYATHGRIQHLGRVVRQRIWCESLKVGTDDKLCRPVWRLHPQKIHSDVRWKTAKEYIVTLSAYIDCFFLFFNAWLVAGLCVVFV